MGGLGRLAGTLLFSAGAVTGCHGEPGVDGIAGDAVHLREAHIARVAFSADREDVLVIVDGTIGEDALCLGAQGTADAGANHLDVESVGTSDGLVGFGYRSACPDELGSGGEAWRLDGALDLRTALHVKVALRDVTDLALVGVIDAEVPVVP